MKLVTPLARCLEQEVDSLICEGRNNRPMIGMASVPKTFDERDAYASILRTSGQVFERVNKSFLLFTSLSLVKAKCR